MAINASYTPSAAAYHFTLPSGLAAVLDIYEFPPNAVSQPLMLLLAKLTPAGWDYVGGFANGQIWNLDEMNLNDYVHPDGTKMSGQPWQIINQFGAEMVTKYVPRMNAALAAEAGSTPAPGPAPTPGNFTDNTQARQYIAGLVFAGTVKYSAATNSFS